MISKHCVINAAYKMVNKHCQECKKNQYYLTDSKRYSFPLLGDSNCNMIIFNCKTLCLIDYLDEIKNMGISSIRIDFSIESPQVVADVCQAYINKFNGTECSYRDRDLTYGYYNDGKDELKIDIVK